MVMGMFFLVVIFSLVYIYMNNKFYLSILLIFEVMTLAVFMGFCYLSGAVFNCEGLYFCVVFLCFGVCEAVLGLSILVSNSRFSGVKMVKSFSLMDL